MKVKKYLPSLLTISNLFLGYLSILYIQKGSDYFTLACYLIILASAFDAFDGKLARRIGLSSKFGKEIDSLADLISFCLAPSILIFNIFSLSTGLPFLYLAFISALPVIMGAIRLARFNLEETDKKYFIGLPSPALAITICAIVLMHQKLEVLLISYLGYNIFSSNIILPVVVLLSFLMIGKIQFSKFPLFTFRHSTQNSIRLGSLILGIILLLLSIINELQHYILFILSTYYIASNIIFHFINNSIKLNELKTKIKKRKL